LLRKWYSGKRGDRYVWRNNTVNTLLLKLYLRLQELAVQESGQDIVEYVLVVALLSFGITAVWQLLDIALAKAFFGISTNLGSYIS
jgi:Flp pilus assembly pilin Flp